MSATPVILGPVAFQDFEVPERINFGGAQRLAVHRLPGGVRVIDAMGRDDADLIWSGTFSGPDAGDRARLLDLLRAQGLPLVLSWDAFVYTVVIARFEANYTSPWWIPYRIACTVAEDEAQAVMAVAADLLGGVTEDLAAAAAGIDVSGSQAAIAVPGAAIAGTAANTAALAAVATDRNALEANLAAAAIGLQSEDLPAALAATGQIASLAVARGYLARAQTNLANVQP
jgi:hypothetical protein